MFKNVIMRRFQNEKDNHMCVQHYTALHSPTRPIVLFIVPFLH